jgi:glycosyltransferase involved in cell wall biosynthesis
MKVLIVEEALKGLHGHWFQYISDIVNGGREAGHEIEVAVHKDACPEILKALPCHPILTATVFEKNTVSAGKLGGFKRILAHNRSLYRDLRAFFSAGNSYDVIIATTPRLDHLPAYEFLHWRSQNGKRPHLVLIFVESVGRYSPDYSRITFGKKSLPLKFALKLSRLLPERKKFSLVTESQGLARQFEKFCGVKFGLVPHVTRLPALDSYREKWKQPAVAGVQPKILGTFGFTRYDKGVDILQSAIKLLAPRAGQPGIRFVLQWTGDYQLPDGSWIRKDPVLENSPLVQYIPAFSASEEYYEWIARTDIMVLPYRKDFYHDKLSRVAIDGALAGMPIVYPAGTWLESFVQEHAAGVAFLPEDPESLAEAIQEVLANFAELKARAEARKQSTREAFSSRTFFDIIEGLPAAKP